MFIPIVERLREKHLYHHQALRERAADEIERLRMLLTDMEYLRAKVNYVTKGHLSHANYLTEKEQGLDLYIEPTAEWMKP